jgi:hypothetical protein
MLLRDASAPVGYRRLEITRYQIPFGNAVQKFPFRVLSQWKLNFLTEFPNGIWELEKLEIS